MLAAADWLHEQQGRTETRGDSFPNLAVWSRLWQVRQPPGAGRSKPGIGWNDKELGGRVRGRILNQIYHKGPFNSESGFVYHYLGVVFFTQIRLFFSEKNIGTEKAS